MKPWGVTLLVFLFWLSATAARSQAPQRGRTDDELRAHLDALGRRLNDAATDIGVRERLAMEMAATLDRAAVSAPTDEARRARWTEAVDVLDRFTAKNPGHLQTRAFQVQASVFVWARARTWYQAFKANPVDRTARKNAAADLEACVKRLQPVCESLSGATDVLAQNARFRLAQATADLAEVGPDDPSARRSRNTEALRPLSEPVTEPSLQGFAHLLRALLLARTDRFEEAQVEADLALKSKPPPPEPEAVEARLAVLLGKKEYPAALKAVNESKLGDGEKAALRARVRLAERLSRVKDREREGAEKALFEELNALRGSSLPESRAALIAAAGALREPGPGQEPVAWDLLASGAVALG
ncbi:MAG: hypothetical protein LC745_08665, partial [Planctomycetia bacterium]|nr:hypothetical protein [Planctomycetia bacterium]